MKLLEVLKIVEQELAQGQETEKVLEFPGKNFSVALFEPEKKLLFSPINGNATSAMRSLINQIKQQGFKVFKVTPRDRGSFEVELERNEDFGMVVDFMRQQLEQGTL